MTHIFKSLWGMEIGESYIKKRTKHTLIPFNNNNNIIIYNNNGERGEENVLIPSHVRNNIIRVLCVSIVRMRGVQINNVIQDSLY